MRDIYELFDLIGQNMKSIRLDVIKKSQEKVADDIDMSRGFLSQIESPNVQIGVSLDTLFILSQKYNFDIRDFFNGYEKLLVQDKKKDS